MDTSRVKLNRGMKLLENNLSVIVLRQQKKANQKTESNRAQEWSCSPNNMKSGEGVHGNCRLYEECSPALP